MIWIVITNTNQCQIYSYDKKIHQLTLVKTLEHPKAKMKGEDLTTDKPGHFKSPTSSHGAFSPHEEAKEVEIEFFSRKIADELNSARTNNSYQELILISQPKMDGILTNTLNENVKKHITKNIKKDLNSLPSHEISRYIQEIIK